MNFLLYMIGRGSGRGNAAIAEGGRPGVREALIATAANQAAAGRLEEALAGYRRLGEMTDENVMDVLIQGHLHLVLGHGVEAQECFASGMELVLDCGNGNGESLGEGSDTSIERLIGKAEGMLRVGGFGRATRFLRRARALLDVVLAAEAGLILAQEDVGGMPRLVSLVKLSDMTLRLLARAQLARQLAGALRERHLQEDLAVWATSSRSVTELLEKEVVRFGEVAKELPWHAETAYRLGLVARAVGRFEEAGSAFECVLGLHPQHVCSAARLAAIGEEKGLGELGVLRKAFEVPAETLRTFGDFAASTGDEEAFDRAARRMGRTDGDRTTAQGNLAFALSELGLLDGAREQWREVVSI